MQVSKSALLSVDLGTTGLADADDVIDYSVSILNNGNVRLQLTGVSDQLGSATPTVLTCAPLLLQPQQSAICNPYQYDVTQNDIDAGLALINVASASAERTTGPSTAMDSDSATINVVPAAPALSIDKSASLVDLDADNLADDGEQIEYSFTVLNTGNVTLQTIMVNDARLGGSFACGAAAPLAPNASVNCGPLSYTVLEADLQQAAVINSATASAVAPGTIPVQSNVDSTSTATDRGDLLFADGFED
jgi:hypothetical protein